MIKGSRVVLRALSRDDLPRLHQFNNDVEVELAGGGDPPLPQSLERLQAEFDSGLGGGGRDGTSFAIEVDGVYIGGCALFNFDQVARRAMLGITIGDKAYWGQGYGRDAVQLLVDYGFRHHITTCTRSGSRCMAATSGPSAPTAPAASRRRAGCANTFGATVCTMTW